MRYGKTHCATPPRSPTRIFLSILSHSLTHRWHCSQPLALSSHRKHESANDRGRSLVGVQRVQHRGGHSHRLPEGLICSSSLTPRPTLRIRLFRDDGRGGACASDADRETQVERRHRLRKEGQNPRPCFWSPLSETYSIASSSSRRMETLLLALRRRESRVVRPGVSFRQV